MPETNPSSETDKSKAEKKASKQADCTSKFRKNVYSLSEHNQSKGTPVVIWYKGDENFAQHFPHGNSKTDRPHLPTLSSTLEDIKIQLTQAQSADLLYAGLSTSTTTRNGKYFFV